MHSLEIDWSILENAKIYLDIYIKYGVFFEAYSFVSNFIDTNQKSPKKYEELFKHFLERSCEFKKVQII